MTDKTVKYKRPYLYPKQKEAFERSLLTSNDKPDVKPLTADMIISVQKEMDERAREAREATLHIAKQLYHAGDLTTESFMDLVVLGALSKDDRRSFVNSIIIEVIDD